jgi:dihydrofolate reductase
MNMTLDGFMAGPDSELDWHFKTWNDDMAKHACEQLGTMDTILLGRVTYEAMADYWPSESMDLLQPREDIAFADMMNSYSKVVFSKTLQKLNWKNARVVRGKIKEEIAGMKQQTGKDMIIYGSGSIVNTLTQLGLVDEFRIWVAPVAIGSGIPLFRDIKKYLNLTLTSVTPVSSGVVILYYRPWKKSNWSSCYFVNHSSGSQSS